MTETRNRLLRVFLCHASQDKPIVRDIYARLLAEGWVEPWLDEEKLLPGEDWDFEIKKAIKYSDVVLICLSNRSQNKEGYLQKEIRYALDIANEKPLGTIFLIPLKLEDCKIPENLSSWQWLNYSDEGAFDKLLRSLIRRAEYLKHSGHEGIFYPTAAASITLGSKTLPPSFNRTVLKDTNVVEQVRLMTLTLQEFFNYLVTTNPSNLTFSNIGFVKDDIHTIIEALQRISDESSAISLKHLDSFINKLKTAWHNLHDSQAAFRQEVLDEGNTARFYGNLIMAQRNIAEALKYDSSNSNL